MLQALFKSLFALVTWKSKTRVTQDKSRSSRGSGPVDSISANHLRPSFISGQTLQPLASKLPSNIKVLQGSDTSKLAAPNIKSKLALSMQNAMKRYLHAGCEKNPSTVLVFRVSFLVELWLALINSLCLSIKFATNHQPPRSGQKDPSARGKFRKPICSI